MSDLQERLKTLKTEFIPEFLGSHFHEALKLCEEAIEDNLAVFRASVEINDEITTLRAENERLKTKEDELVDLCSSKISHTIAERDTLRAQVEHWEEEAKRYAQNADHWLAKAERLEGEKAVLLTAVSRFKRENMCPPGFSPNTESKHYCNTTEDHLTCWTRYLSTLDAKEASDE